ncbi:hypothetical protein RYH80_12095 [Halobaculum sp. MBLA0147]|uniref:hypothetical protein n=1 Tax=Halobaculum sp. MBLA0147 TaxID=3079934 RepID=UPI003523270B
MEKESGNIYAHSQSGYPDDPEKRSRDEDENVSQARKYARYYVYRNTDYDTLEGHWNPDRVAATAMALWRLSDEEVDELFGTFRQQCRSHFEDVDRPLRLPSTVGADEAVVYEQELYLDADVDDIRGAVDEFEECIADSAADVLASVSRGSLLDRTLDGILGTVRAEANDTSFEFPPYEVADTSELGVMYYDANDESHRVGGGGGPTDEKPDARVELPQLEPETLDTLKPLLLRHLVSQVRDFYIVMGEEPPPAFRVLGPGKHAPTQGYGASDFYPNYYDFDADIPGYQS